MSKAAEATTPESDRFGEFPHPRMTYELFGHRPIEQYLLKAYRDNKLPQSIILGGAEGIGKATLAWRMARFLAANPDPASSAVEHAGDLYVDSDHPAARKIEALADSDVFLLRREWNFTRKRLSTDISVDDVRKMITRFQQSSSRPGWRVGIIDSVDDLNRSSANAMLKLIEEPPPRSLFLFVANRPAQILATIRSRSQVRMMAPLAPADVKAAIAAMGPPWSNTEPPELEKAVERGQGSVRDALRCLESDTSLLDEFDAFAAQLPRINWAAAHALAESVAKRDKTEEFEALLAAIYDWLSTQLNARTANTSGGPVQAGSLAPLAELWEKIAITARQVETYNLDRRPFLLTLFSDLANVAAPRGE